MREERCKISQNTSKKKVKCRLWLKKMSKKKKKKEAEGGHPHDRGRSL